LGDRSNTTRALIGLARVESARNHPKEAAAVFGAADALMQGPSAYIGLADHADYERSITAVREALGPEAFQAAWDEGKHRAPGELLRPNDEVNSLVQLISVVRERDVADQSAGGTELSERELEVLRAVTLGHTNVQVADMLSISPHTVNNHLRSIFSKLGVSSRSALTRYAIVNKLV
jgi:DNA-binding NarL/FixJ family response regulator